MSNVLTQTIVYLLLLFIGYGFKKAGIFKVEDSDFLKSVILYITMPAAAVNGLKRPGTADVFSVVLPDRLCDMQPAHGSGDVCVAKVGCIRETFVFVQL